MSTRKQLSRAQLLSQFFTNPDIARKLVKLTKSKLKEHAGIVWHSLFFIEPSAGDGAFSDCLPKHKTRAVEVDPELLERHPEFIGADLEHGGFLGLDKSALNLSGIPNSRILCIGNPPFSAPKFTGRSRQHVSQTEYSGEIESVVSLPLGSGPASKDLFVGQEGRPSHHSVSNMETGRVPTATGPVFETGAKRRTLGRTLAVC